MERRGVLIPRSGRGDRIVNLTEIASCKARLSISEENGSSGCRLKAWWYVSIAPSKSPLRCFVNPKAENADALPCYDKDTNFKSRSYILSLVFPLFTYRRQNKTLLKASNGGLKLSSLSVTMSQVEQSGFPKVAMNQLNIVKS
jgi:hypothetical protein